MEWHEDSSSGASSESIAVENKVLMEIIENKQDGDTFEEFLIQNLGLVPGLSEAIGDVQASLKPAIRDLVEGINEFGIYSVNFSDSGPSKSIEFFALGSENKIAEVRVYEDEAEVFTVARDSQLSRSGTIKMENDNLITKISYLNGTTRSNNHNDLVEKSINDISVRPSS